MYGFLFLSCECIKVLLFAYSECTLIVTPNVVRLYSDCIPNVLSFQLFPIVAWCSFRTKVFAHKGLHKCSRTMSLGSWCGWTCGAGKGQGRQPEERRRIHDHEAPKAASIPTPHTQTTFTLALLWAMLCSHGYPQRQCPAFCMKFSALVHRYSG